MQKTIRDIITFSGIGLHTGCDAFVRILPSGPDTGITFVRKDLPGAPRIRALSSKVLATSYATSLGSGGASVSTVEHILAAFYGLGVDNAVVELEGPEVPILDGSSAEFVSMIDAVGTRELDAPRKYIVIKKPIKVADHDKYILLLPVDGMEFTVDYSIDFAHPFLSKQTFSKHFSKDVFKEEVGRARTFGFLRDVEMLRANGLAKGGSLSNAVVVGDNEILNEGGLRYPDEFVRHKVLDLMGDISLVGAQVIGHIIAHRSGHSLNNLLVRQILRRPTRWELSESQAAGVPHDAGHVYLDKVATL